MTSRPTVGVLTFHRCINYGSYWQARALVEGLRARGADAMLLDHDSRHVNFAEWRCALRPTLPLPAPREDRPRYRRKIEKFFAAFETLPLSRRFDLVDPRAMPRCDAVVVGSDEVWNLWHPWFGGASLFYGVGVRAGKLISYAASFGNYPASQGLDGWWREQLRSFDAISVRDQNSRQLVQNALGTPPPLVLDPCLQFDCKPEGSWNGPNEPFLLLYGHGFSARFWENARRFARERGWMLLSIGYRNEGADAQWLDAGPHDFALAMQSARGVATNFFHGCVFALKNEKPLAVEITPYRTHKVRDLMDLLGANHHLLDESAPFERLEERLSAPPDASISQKIEELRGASNGFLNAALSLSLSF